MKNRLYFFLRERRREGRVPQTLALCGTKITGDNRCC